MPSEHKEPVPYTKRRTASLDGNPSFSEVPTGTERTSSIFARLRGGSQNAAEQIPLDLPELLSPETRQKIFPDVDENYCMTAEKTRLIAHNVNYLIAKAKRDNYKPHHILIIDSNADRAADYQLTINLQAYCGNGNGIEHYRAERPLNKNKELETADGNQLITAIVAEVALGAAPNNQPDNILFFPEERILRVLAKTNQEKVTYWSLLKKTLREKYPETQFELLTTESLYHITHTSHFKADLRENLTQQPISRAEKTVSSPQRAGGNMVVDVSNNPANKPTSPSLPDPILPTTPIPIDTAVVKVESALVRPAQASPQPAISQEHFPTVMQETHPQKNTSPSTTDNDRYFKHVNPENKAILNKFIAELSAENTQHFALPSHTALHEQLTTEDQQYIATTFNNASKQNKTIDQPALDLIIACGAKNFTGMDLCGMNLNGKQLQACDFKNAKMDGCRCEKTNFERSIFKNATLTKADLQKANICAASFYGANLAEAKVQDVCLDIQTDFRKCNACDQNGNSAFSATTLIHFKKPNDKIIVTNISRLYRDHKEEVDKNTSLFARFLLGLKQLFSKKPAQQPTSVSLFSEMEKANSGSSEDNKKKTIFDRVIGSQSFLFKSTNHGVVVNDEGDMPFSCVRNRT